MRIAIDGMGGDHAPREIVLGAVSAARADPGLTLLLVGDRARLEAELATAPDRPAGIQVVHASQVIEMQDHPVEAMRKKPDNSMQRAVNLVKEGQADAVISAGNTGGAVASSMFTLGLIPGVKRAGIAVPLPHETGLCILCDAGANIYPKPLHLLQYAAMATVYARVLHGIERPRVGLLNVGEEDEKGTELHREVLGLLQKSALNVVGNVEGRDIFSDTCDVAVCDGFVGNVILKATEGCAEALLRMVGGELARGAAAAAGAAATAGGSAGGGVAALIKDALSRVKDRIDYSEYGGAPLLGVNGVSIIAHGRSKAKAIANAVRVAADLARRGLTAGIKDAIAALPRPDDRPAAQATTG
ncbi:MAG: phosphate acyltransferase PlsX [Planctomycetes bacterium]|nr:phosphate acyltransferase PlsX [Planctomycetota bacterium]